MPFKLVTSGLPIEFVFRLLASFMLHGVILPAYSMNKPTVYISCLSFCINIV